MFEWLQKSFEEHTILWLVMSSTLGGIIGASLRFVFDVILPQQLQDRREVISAKKKYSTPILLAADELRRRLENMIKHVDMMEKEDWMSDAYFYQTTLYVVGQFFGWLRILRRTVVYLDFTTTKETRRFEGFLDAIEAGFSDPDLLREASTGIALRSEDKWVNTYWLQAIGDSMVTSEDGQPRTIGFASFSNCFSQSKAEEFEHWYGVLGDMFRGMKANNVRFRRIVATHAILNAFINYLDPKHLRTEEQPDHWELLPPEEAECVEKRIKILLANPES